MTDLRALLAAATSGPWCDYEWFARESDEEPSAWCIATGPITKTKILGEAKTEADAALIVALRNNAEALLDERDKLLGEVERLREALEPFACEADAQERVTSYRDGDCLIVRPKITIGELRRARAALSHGGAEG